jgi:predicted RNase H-like HicB family nuclease
MTIQRRKAMKYVFTAIFSPEPDDDNAINVSFPDLPGCYTCGDSLEDAIAMAKDALCLWLYDKEQTGASIPVATSPQKINPQGNDFITAIAVDTNFYKRFYENKAVKKTLTIPSWLNKEAEEANINFSQILQTALKNELHLVN